MPRHLVERTFPVRSTTTAVLVLLGMVLVSCATASGPGAVGTRPTTGPNTNPPPAGPSVHEVARTTTLAGTSVGPATVTCPTGEVGLGGGWEVPAPASGGSLHAALVPSAIVSLEGARIFKAVLTGDTWAVYVSHADLRVSQTLPVTAYIECLQGLPGAIVTQRTLTQDAAPEVIQEVAQRCNYGESAVGFGFDFSAAPATLEFAGDRTYYISPFGQWHIWVANHESVAHPISAFVQCLSHVNVSMRSLAAPSPSLPGGATVDVQQSCPSGTAVVGGGVVYHYAILGGGNLYRQHASSAGWQGSLSASTGSSPLDITDVNAACLKFF